MSVYTALNNASSQNGDDNSTNTMTILTTALIAWSKPSDSVSSLAILGSVVGPTPSW